jgi:hypothetical protein
MWAGDLDDNRCEEQSYCSEDLMFIIFISIEINGLDHPKDCIYGWST